ncbi:MAG: hypothetical protein D6B25_14440 [Desulfobulbaceae bacterium]|nr:MAG: hypothetical protein D6B25_14440 [Desulfobulbaceae bacterium]
MNYFRSLLSVCVLFICSMTITTTVSAEEMYTEAHKIVDQSKVSLQRFLGDPNMQAFRDLAKRARAIIIIPKMFRGGLVVGGTGGDGVMIARDMTTGKWHGPAFYSIGSVTFGLQIGAQSSQVMMVIMTQKGLNSTLSSSFKLGADVSMAAGPIGGGTKAATADILAYSISKGAFGGFTVEGAIIESRVGWNHSFYKDEVTTTDILINGTAKNDYANGLIELLNEIAVPTTQKVTY